MDTSQIREHMKVVDADGQHIGTVDRVEGDQIKLTKDDSQDAQHHYVALADVEDVSDGEVRLSQDARLA
jgi:hypothetical protein